MKRIALLLSMFLLNQSQAKIAHDFTLRDQQGELVNLLQLSSKANKFILLVFFQTDCAPCVEEIKSIKNYLQKNSDLTVILIDTKEERSKTYHFSMKHQLTDMLILNDPYGLLDQDYNISAVPVMFLLNSKLDILKTFHGNKFNELLFYIKLKSKE